MQVVIKECVQRIICIDVEALLEGLVNGLACMLPKTLPFAAGLLEQRLASSFQTEVAAAGKLFSGCLGTASPGWKLYLAGHVPWHRKNQEA